MYAYVAMYMCVYVHTHASTYPCTRILILHIRTIVPLSRFIPVSDT